MSFGELIKDYQNDIINTISEAVKFPSTLGVAEEGKPFGKACSDVLEYVLNLADSFGLKTVNLDGYCGYAEYGEGKELAAVVTHLDVVPAGEGWDYEPFAGVITENAVWGRGSSDNKGSAIIALYCLKALKDKGIVPNRRIRIIFGVNEETGMKDIEYYLANDELPDMAFTPDCNYPIFRGELGIAFIEVFSKKTENGIKIYGGNAVNMVPDRAFMELSRDVFGKRFDEIKEMATNFNHIKITTEETDLGLKLIAFGKSAHGAMPQNGINAISNLVKFAVQEELTDSDGIYAFINEKVSTTYDGSQIGIAFEDDITTKPLTFNLGVLESENDGNIVKFDIRYPIKTNVDEMFEKINLATKEYGLEYRITKNSPPFYVGDDERIIHILKKSYKEMTGTDAELKITDGGTYSRMFMGRCVGFGSVGVNLHQPNEHSTFEDILYHSRICLQAMHDMAISE